VESLSRRAGISRPHSLELFNFDRQESPSSRGEEEKIFVGTGRRGTYQSNPSGPGSKSSIVFSGGKRVKNTDRDHEVRSTDSRGVKRKLSQEIQLHRRN